MNSFVLKLVALVAMLIDHTGKAFARGVWGMQYVGRLAFPIFAYQTAVSYRHTRNLDKYVKRLAVFAGASQLPYSLFMWVLGEDGLRLNIGFTLLGAVVALALYERLGKGWRWLPFIIAGILAETLRMDYGAYGVAVVGLCAYLVRLMEDTAMSKRQLAWRVGAVVALYGLATMARYLPWAVKYPMYAVQYGWQIIWAIAALLLVLTHNGWKGRDARWLFYGFYPAHLLVIGILYIVMITIW